MNHAGATDLCFWMGKESEQVIRELVPAHRPRYKEKLRRRLDQLGSVRAISAPALACCVRRPTACNRVSGPSSVFVCSSTASTSTDSGSFSFLGCPGRLRPPHVPSVLRTPLDCMLCPPHRAVRLCLGFAPYIPVSQALLSNLGQHF